MSRKIQTINSISEAYKLSGLGKPEHPLIGLIRLEDVIHTQQEPTNLVFNFYTILIKRCVDGKLKYGQNHYDFDKGVLAFMKPGQVISTEEISSKAQGWCLVIHPDFFWNTPLAKKIHQYEFFDYGVNEALFLSEKEEKTINGIIENIRQEYHSNIDKFSKQIIITHIESLLSYSERFYNRQFITREKAAHQILERLEKLLSDYFNSEDLISKGLPTVQYVAAQLNLSPSYLSDMLRSLTGQNTQQHIHDKLIEKAKEKLSTTNLTISEIAYELGFEHPQSFNKLFKSKVSTSPSEFRASFN